MRNNKYPVLCGGTFFILVLEAQAARSGKRTQIYGTPDGLSAPETLAGLVRVFYPAFKLPSDKKNAGTITSDYRYCKNEGVNLPFQNIGDVDLFDERVQTDYQTALKAMEVFVAKFIDTTPTGGKDVRLVKALLDLIEHDEDIDPADKFYALQNGDAISKVELIGQNEFYFPSFLLGVWHFVVKNRKNSNISGQTPADKWCPKNGNRKERQYKGTMGSDISRKIVVSCNRDVENKESGSEPMPEPKSYEGKKRRYIMPEHTAPQTPHITMTQIGNGNIQLPPVTGGVITINMGQPTPQSQQAYRESAKTKPQAQSQYKFVFTIDNNGVAAEFSTQTVNALREWFYDYAREDLSDCKDEELIDTFEIEIIDERVLESEKKFNEVNSKIRRGEVLTEQDEHFYSVYKKQRNHFSKCNKVKTEALRFYLSDRTNRAAFSIFEYTELNPIIFAILNYHYEKLINLNIDGTEILDVFLNSNGYNKKHEQFIAVVKKEHLEERFGQTGVYDLYGRAFMDLGEYRSEVAPFFYIHIAELKLLDNFDFSTDKRILSLLHYWIGLH